MQPVGAPPWREVAGCVIVRVRVTPKSSLDAIEGIETTPNGPALKVRVRAPPSEGEANAAVERLLAGWLDVPKSRVKVTAGTKSRLKSLKVTGEPRELAERIRMNQDEYRAPAGVTTGGRDEQGETHRCRLQE